MRLNAFNQFLKPDGTPGTGINQVCIASCPCTETGIEQRFQGPAIICPTQIPVQMLLCGIKTHPCCFRRVRKGKRIRICLGTGSIIGGPLAFRSTTHPYFFGKFLTDANAVIVHVFFDSIMIIPCKRNFKLRIGFPNHFQCFLHDIHRAFVHGNRTDIEPTFLTQMGRKRG